VLEIGTKEIVGLVQNCFSLSFTSFGVCWTLDGVFIAVHLRVLLPNVEGFCGFLPVAFNLVLWPCFKMVVYMHLRSLCTANAHTLEDDVHPHYITRSCAEFAGSLLHLNVNYRDGQVSFYFQRMQPL